MPKSKELKFEDQLKRLDEIVNHLESQDASLDDSLELFEEGVKLARTCQARLDETQKKIEVLIKETGELKPYDA